MEIKTILYIIVGVIWLLSRFFQKQRQDQAQDADRTGETSFPSEGNSPQSEAGRVQNRQLPARKPTTIKRNTRTSPDFLPSAISLETPLAKPIQRGAISPTVADSEEATGSTIPSEAERIADEIRNGRMDWKRAVIISELIDKRNGL